MISEWRLLDSIQFINSQFQNEIQTWIQSRFELRLDWITEMELIETELIKPPCR